MKLCRGCGLEKDFSKFYRNHTRKGYTSRCKDCMAGYVRANRAKIKERWRVWAFKHGIKTRYGLTVEQYEQLLEDQHGTCAICNKQANIVKTRRLSVDHNHNTNQVRGLLCNNCNNGLGRFMDDPNLLRTAAAYLELYDEEKAA